MSLNLKKSLKAAALAAMLFSAAAANAALYKFELTGDYTASWQLNSTVAPDDYADGVGFILFDVEGNFPGSVFDVADLTFYNADADGGIQIDDFYGDTTLLITDGGQLYSGPESTPTFLTGTFALSEFGGTGSYTLTVTDLDAPPPPSGDVPEPASVALMAGGLGLMAALRRRRYGK